MFIIVTENGSCNHTIILLDYIISYDYFILFGPSDLYQTFHTMNNSKINNTLYDMI